jgi:hypothetical protein
MLKYYVIHYTTYWHGKDMGTCIARTICDEGEVNNFRKKVTWENLANIVEEVGGLACNFSIWNMKKGRQISFRNTWPWQEPKEWKGKDLDIEIQAEWVERELSIKEAMEWHNATVAIQYLNERNLRIGVDK